MTVQQKGWIKYGCKYAALFGSFSLSLAMGLQCLSFGVAAVCVYLVQIYVFGDLWAGEVLPVEEVKRQRIHVAIGVGIFVSFSLFAQLIVFLRN